MKSDKNIDAALAAQKKYYTSGRTRQPQERIKVLKKLREVILIRTEDIGDALRSDLGKSSYESYLTETSIVLHELKVQIKNLRRWSKAEKVRSPFFLWPSKSRIVKEPYGHVLIISPWNYPFQLLMAPLVDAVAAGNVAAVKPSHKTPRTAAVINDIIAEVFDAGWVSAFVGETDISTYLLARRFDYIFFTGSPRVGKIVMAAAAPNLTPVTLELGGKSPCVVDSTADVKVAARRIVWGKLINAGQTCIAPDYVLVHSAVRDELLARMAEVIKQFYGDDPQSNPDYPRIITSDAAGRLAVLLEGQKIYFGGDHNAKDRYFGPTIVTDPDPSSQVMQEEIFGPILPVLTVDNMEKAVEFINEREKPLALYFFGKKSDGRIIVNATSAGGSCINDTLLHIANAKMPFGGVGNSGMGSYHGRAGFDTFTHKRAVLVSGNLVDFPVKYPPFKNVKTIKKLM